MLENPTEKELLLLVASVIHESTGRAVEIRLEHKLIEDGYLDSMSIVNLILALEEKYGAQVDIMDVTEENFGSIAAITKTVSERRVV
jgi:acyl carrier protein